MYGHSIRLILGCFLLCVSQASGLRVETVVFEHGFTEGPGVWATWAPRTEISPGFQYNAEAGRLSPGCLEIEGKGDAAHFGAWKCIVKELTAGSLYRFEAWYQTQGVDNDQRSVIPRLHWKDDKGKQVQPPDFATGSGKEDTWTKVDYLTRAPEHAAQLEIQLGFGFASRGRVLWDDVSLKEVSGSVSRMVRVATIHHKPRQKKTAEESVDAFLALIDKAAAEKPDIICLPEGITTVGNPLNYIEVSETIPGPTTDRLGEAAKQHACYLVAGVYERVGKVVYNTAVLMDRKGKVAGVYRKTHLPREEWEGGITPGNTYPVFDTDFGKIGMIICWDVQFPEPARAMARKGAEVLFLPIWGGSDVLTQARAIENHVFLVSSSYGMRSYVLDPTGEILAEATEEKPFTVTEIDLDKQYLQEWLGNMKHRTWKERRPDIDAEM